MVRPPAPRRRPHTHEASMIPRYSRPDMVAIWEPETRFRIWWEIEAHACDAQADLGIIPKEAAKAVWERGGFDIPRTHEKQHKRKHAVLHCLTTLANHAC